MSENKAAHENPLIPNARLRQMYRAILRAHLMGQALPVSQRALTAGREAALVSTSIDLTARDLVAEALSSPIVDFLRGMPLHRALASKSKSLRRTLADCGSGSHLPAPDDPDGRLWSAVGAAAMLKSAAEIARAETKKPKATAHDSAIVVASVLPGEIRAETWKPALGFAGRHDLPIIFVVLPAAAGPKRTSRTAKGVDLRALTHLARVPAIPVDAADPVALYRAAQESIGHARIGGGPAVIECISFPTASGSHSTAGPADAAIAHLEQYILARGIATRAWMDGEAASFSAQIRSLKSASK